MEYLNTMQIKFSPQYLRSVDTFFEKRVETVVIEISWFFSVSSTECWVCSSRQLHRASLSLEALNSCL